MNSVMAFLPYLIIAALVSVVCVLFLGIFSMSKGGEFNARYGNLLMRLRVILQGVTILLLGLMAVLTLGYGGSGS